MPCNVMAHKDNWLAFCDSRSTSHDGVILYVKTKPTVPSVTTTYKSSMSGSCMALYHWQILINLNVLNASG